MSGRLSQSVRGEFRRSKYSRDAPPLSRAQRDRPIDADVDYPVHGE